MLWNEDRDAELRGHWSAGKSQTQIMALMGLNSPGAVAGRARRLGLPRRSTREGGWAAKRAKEAAARKPNSAKPKPNSVIAKPITKPKPAPYISTSPSDDVARVSLLELEAGLCKWPVGEPVKGFCGCQAIEGKSYCADHLSRSIQKPASYAHPFVVKGRINRVFS